MEVLITLVLIGLVIVLFPYIIMGVVILVAAVSAILAGIVVVIQHLLGMR